MSEDYPFVSIYELKTNLSKYIRQLERGSIKGVAVRRYQKMVAMLVAVDPGLKKPEA